MSEILTELMFLASFIMVFVTALVETYKRACPAFPTQFLPLLAIVLGLVVGYLMHISFELDVSLAYLLWGGGIAGLASVGLFEGVKSIMPSVKK